MKPLRAKVTRHPSVHTDLWWKVRVTFLGLTIRRAGFITHREALDYAARVVGL